MIFIKFNFNEYILLSKMEQTRKKQLFYTYKTRKTRNKHC